MKRIIAMAIATAAVALMIAPVYAAEPVELEMWVAPAVTEAGPPPADWKVYKILKDKLNINLKLVFVPATPGDQDTKLSTAAAANRLPDVFFANRDPWMKLVQKGMIGSVDEIWKKMPTRVKKYYDDPESQQLVSYKGKKYGFPDPGSSVAPAVEGLVIRQDWLDKLKLKMPTTLDELFAVAKAFTEQDPDGNGKNDTYGYGAFLEQNGLLDAGLGRRFYPIFGAFGVPVIWDASAKSFGLAVRKAEYQEALAFVKKMQDAKVLDPDWATLKKEEFRTRFKEGKFGIMFEQFAALHAKANYGQFDKNNPKGSWAVVPSIKGPKGLAYSTVTTKSIRLYTVSAKAAKDPKKAEAIAKLYEWIASDEGYYLLGFGEKDVNFKLNDKGIVVYDGIDKTKQTTAKEMQPMTQLRNIVYTNDDKELIPRYPSHKTGDGRTIDPLATLKAMNKSPIYNATAASFINPPTNAADFKRYFDEEIMKFVRGQNQLNKANYDAFIKGLDSLGAGKWEKDAKEYLASIDMLK